MKQGLTYIIFVIDRSGSMESIRTDMIGGFNAFIREQKSVNPGDCRVVAYKFDTVYEPMFEDKPLAEVPELTTETYEPRGSTALYDSLAKTIVDIGARLAALPEDQRPERVLIATITDGEDNSHLTGDFKHYTSEQVKEMVDHQRTVYSWDFAYIGANQDAWAVGGNMGYAASSTLNYVADSDGTAYAFDKLSKGVTSYRCCAVKADFAFDADDQNPQGKAPVNPAPVNPAKKSKKS